MQDPASAHRAPAQRAEVLLVEDDADLAASVTEYLTLSGVGVEHAPDAATALQALEGRSFAVVLLDVTLPGMSGLEVCRQVRRSTDVPIVFLSARTTEADQVLGLSLGGDDYIVKPFSLAVLLAKVQRLVARHEPDGTGAGYDDGHLRVDPATGRVHVGGEEVALKAMEFRLLAYLVAHAGRVIGKREIFEQVWGDTITGDGTLNVHVRRVRTKIEPDPAHPTYLRTVWGRGLIFEGRA